MKRKQLLISTTAALTLSVLLSLPTVYGCITPSHKNPCADAAPDFTPPIVFPKIITYPRGIEWWGVEKDLEFVHKANKYYLEQGLDPGKAREQAYQDLEKQKRGPKPDTLYSQ